MRSRAFLLAFFLFLTPIYGATKPPELTARDTKIKIEEILRTHATYHSLNQELVKRAFENYLNELDPNFSYFIEPEIVKWTNPSEELLAKALDGYKKEDYSA